MPASVVVPHGLGCPMACGILVPGSEIESVSLVLAGGFLTPGPAGKPLDGLLRLHPGRNSVTPYVGENWVVAQTPHYPGICAASNYRA